jgi:arsenate reductase (thioredoxin)
MVPPRGIRGGRPRMGGDTPARPVQHQPAPPVVRQSQPPVADSRKRVLFVCIGNSCRSQMAEAFARAYGPDVLSAHSAGLSPAMIIQPLTREVLLERNVRTDGQFPKDLQTVLRESFDVVVNMSGERLQVPGTRVIDWPVQDPIGQTEQVYRTVATQVEGLVMRLILELRGS